MQNIYFTKSKDGKGKTRFHGLLYDLYRNKVRFSKQNHECSDIDASCISTVIHSSTLNSAETSQMTSTNDDSVTQEIDDKNWLLHHTEPLELVIQKWENTFNIRRAEILLIEKCNDEMTVTSRIFKSWPLLKQANGKLLVYDFFLQLKNYFFNHKIFTTLILD